MFLNSPLLRSPLKSLWSSLFPFSKIPNSFYPPILLPAFSSQRQGWLIVPFWDNIFFFQPELLEERHPWSIILTEQTLKTHVFFEGQTATSQRKRSHRLADMSSHHRLWGLRMQRPQSLLKSSEDWSTLINLPSSFSGPSWPCSSVLPVGPCSSQ